MQNRLKHRHGFSDTSKRRPGWGVADIAGAMAASDPIRQRRRKPGGGRAVEEISEASRDMPDSDPVTAPENEKISPPPLTQPSKKEQVHGEGGGFRRD